MAVINLGLKNDWRVSIVQDTIDTWLYSVLPTVIGHPQFKQTIIPASQLLTLKAQPVIVVPAPGPGLIAMAHECFMQYKFQGTPYSNTGNNDMQIYWQAAGAGVAIITDNSNGLLNASSDQIEDAPILADIQSARNVAENQPLVLAHTGGVSEFGAGNGLLIVSMMYVLVNLV